MTETLGRVTNVRAGGGITFPCGTRMPRHRVHESDVEAFQNSSQRPEPDRQPR